QAVPSGTPLDRRRNPLEPGFGQRQEGTDYRVTGTDSCPARKPCRGNDRAGTGLYGNGARWRGRPCSRAKRQEGNERPRGLHGLRVRKAPGAGTPQSRAELWEGCFSAAAQRVVCQRQVQSLGAEVGGGKAPGFLNGVEGWGPLRLGSRLHQVTSSGKG